MIYQDNTTEVKLTKNQHRSSVSQKNLVTLTLKVKKNTEQCHVTCSEVIFLVQVEPHYVSQQQQKRSTGRMLYCPQVTQKS